MSARTDDDDTQHRMVGMNAGDIHQYAHLTIENGEVVIYDRDNESAWIQSSSALGLEFVR